MDVEDKNQKKEEKPEFKEGVDYYFENGLMVLTAEFLRKRGYCCGSGCRHCPYPKKDADQSK
ncbi:MAG TPA: DUF5522 domain-containing protein [Pyrinomonadaceae bacterium]|jgi:hypothetical protein|nr:DUF5522 domain-containing protein [Pyrinomonadaceae bacterium]